VQRRTAARNADVLLHHPAERDKGGVIVILGRTLRGVDHWQLEWNGTQGRPTKQNWQERKRLGRKRIIFNKIFSGASQGTENG
jgi:hypothetical protein